MPVRSPHCKYVLNACLKKGDLSRITSIHGRAQVDALDGLTVHDALTMSYFVNGKYKRYANQDLNYDVNNGSLLVLDAATPVVNDTKVIFDTTPLSPVKQHVDGIGIVAVSSSFFSPEAEQAIRIHADNDPLIDLGGWCVQLDLRTATRCATKWCLTADPMTQWCSTLFCLPVTLPSCLTDSFTTHWPKGLPSVVKNV